MNIGNIGRTLGILLTMFSVTMLPPLFISWYSHDNNSHAFFYGFLASILSGLLLWGTCYKFRGFLSIRDGIVITCLFWTILSLFGAIPIYIGIPYLGVTNSIFESISGFTTTGATVISDIASLPVSILFYRHQLQWLGGIGIVVLAITILPLIGAGGIQLYRAETTGSQNSYSGHFSGSIAHTAKIISYIYIVLTIACMLAYFFAGMSLFDAITHSFSTVSIGGFSTYDQSFAAFNDNPMIEYIAVFFMFVAGINFSLHFYSWKKHSIKHYFRDPEFIFYVFLLSFVTISCLVILVLTNTKSITESFRPSLFQAVSISTTTGYSTENFSQWPLVLPILLMLASFVGGCSGSTAGGIKVVRILIVIKQGYRELKQSLHPNAVFNIKLSGRMIYNKTIMSIWGFLSVYAISFAVITLLLATTGLDGETAWSAAAAALNNLGPGLGDVSVNYSNINDPAKWILSFTMLLGRLEIITLIVLFTPLMWRP